MPKPPSSGGKVVKTLPQTLSPAAAARLAKDYVSVKEAVANFTERQDSIKKLLKDWVLGQGYVDDKGHTWWDVPGEKFKLQVQRRVSQSLDPDKAMAFLEANDLVDACTVTQVMVDEDALLAANMEGKVSDEELAGLYTEKVTQGFYVVEG